VSRVVVLLVTLGSVCVYVVGMGATGAIVYARTSPDTDGFRDVVPAVFAGICWPLVIVPILLVRWLEHHGFDQSLVDRRVRAALQREHADRDRRIAELERELGRSGTVADD
jgi:hypothetical protein